MANCGVMPATLLEAFLSAGRVNEAGEEYINLIAIVGANDDSAIACGENISDPEALIVAKFFGVDTNGHLGLKVKTI
jgi:hypothetical protein